MGSPLPTSPATTWCTGSGTRRRSRRGSPATACSAAPVSSPRRASRPSSITARAPGRNQLAFALDDDLEKWTKPCPDRAQGRPTGKQPQMRSLGSRLLAERRHVLRHQRRRQPEPDEVFGPEELDVPRAASARRLSGEYRHGQGRRHLLRQHVQDRQEMDAAVHQPPVWAAATTWATSRTRSICPSSRR